MDPELTPHSFRHTFGTRLGEYADVTQIQQLMGHSSPLISQRYVHSRRKDLGSLIVEVEKRRLADRDKRQNGDRTVWETAKNSEEDQQQ